jgi:exonuclease III
MFSDFTGSTEIGDKLIISSFNCKNVKSSGCEILKLCKNCDIVLLQETWLFDYDLPYLASISEDFYAKGISSIDSSSGIHTGRPYGGLAILWRKSIAGKCKLIDHDDSRIMGIEIEGDSVKLQLLNVYLPYSSADNYDDFVFYLSKLDSIIADYSSPYIFVMGDFNADVRLNAHNQENNKFGRELSKFCQDENYVLSDVSYLKDTDTFTYYSEAHGTVSWLDHVLSTVNGHALVSDVKVDSSFVTSDHLPITLSLDFTKNLINPCSNDGMTNMYSNNRVKWDELSNSDLIKYKDLTEDSLSRIPLEHDLLLCDNADCCNPSHISAINRLHANVICALKEASADLQQASQPSYKQRPGWNDYCREVHADARDDFLMWTHNGRPRQGPTFDAMKRSRAQFKAALRYCSKVQSRAKADAIAKHYLSKDSKVFWKEVKKLNNDYDILSDSINGVSGQKNIVHVWQNHFQTLLNSSSDVTYKSSVLSSLQSINSCDMELITPKDIYDAIHHLKAGKSAGLDGIFSEHYTYASPKIACILSLLFNSCIIHGFLPKELMDTVIVPIVKDKKADITSMDNYRPIAITCIVSKILEIVLLKRCSEFLYTTSNQFGFKSKHATDLAVFSLKQVIEFYQSKSSPVYVCYLDASKAFDRINHWILFHKLLDRNVPNIIVRLIYTWYTQQNFIIRWGNTLSQGFNVSNGVRQGGILSPYFFNLYINDLSVCLTKREVGCFINDTCVNHLIYADDAVLIAPSPAALQKLVDVCHDFASKHDISFNVKKTVCSCFKPKSLKDIYVPSIYLGGNCLRYVNCQKYLGVFLHEDFSDDRDIVRQTRYIYARGNSLIRKFKDCSPEVKTQLFKSYCTAFYCSSLWSNFKTATFTKLKVSFKRVFRNLHNIKSGSTTGFMLQLNCDPIDVILRKYINSFRNRLFKSDNVIICAIRESMDFSSSSINELWVKTLFSLTT